MAVKKAFIASLLTIIMVVLLLLLSLYIQSASLAFEHAINEPLPLLSGRFFFTDVFTDVNALIGPEFSIFTSNTSTNPQIFITVAESFPKNNFSAVLDSYRTFIIQDFSSRSHINTSINFSNITDGTLELYFLERYVYVHNYSIRENNSMNFNPIDAGFANIRTIEINFTVLKARRTIQQFNFDVDGDLFVTVLSTDNNGSTTMRGLLDSDEINQAVFSYGDNSSVVITIGKIKNDIDSSVSISDLNASPAIVLFMNLSLPSNNTPYSVRYNAILNYSNFNISKSGFVER